MVVLSRPMSYNISAIGLNALLPFGFSSASGSCAELYFFSVLFLLFLSTITIVLASIKLSIAFSSLILQSFLEGPHLSATTKVLQILGYIAYRM
jgi:hypothetical protein